MRKFILFLGLTIMMAISTLLLQGCNNSEAQEPSTQHMATAPAASTSTVSVSTIGWSALSTEEKDGIISIGESHPFNGVVCMDPKMIEVISIMYLEDVPSAAPKQTLIEYRYERDTLLGTNIMLLQGHLEGVKKIESIPDVLNNSCGCYQYGGCIKSYKCDQQPLPAGKNCEPCKQPKEKCLPCERTAGKRQADGAAAPVNPDGENRKIIIW